MSAVPEPRPLNISPFIITPSTHIAISTMSSETYITSLRLSISVIFITKKYSDIKNTTTDNMNENSFMPFNF